MLRHSARIGSLAFLVFFFFSGSVFAGEGLWIYAQGTDTRPKGTLELKLANISRLGKDRGDYAFHDLRPEVEYGVTNRLTLSFEAILFSHDYSVDDDTLNPMFESQGGEGGSFKSSQIGGFETSLKYNLLSPYKDPVGLSVGFSYEYRQRYRLDGAEISQNSYVPTLYLQKNFLDDTLTLALKSKLEFELRKSPGVREEEIAPDIALGLSYRFKPRWTVGFESRYQSDYLEPEEEGEPAPEDPSEFTSLGNFRFGLRYQYGLYAGPSIHYAQRGWWVTLGSVFQVSGGGDASNPSVRDGRSWDEHERAHVGLTFGFEF
ncbi:DUF6662 family protein [Acanthopleuribacter pedis]|uniref:Uncharacterized protein n=1 Tax=Acanthopleuribacter pedis TaxID=442870 RepID=A0A8J7Q8R4_9BACT|nr:DUF6662 family protein [Acanthopleuribacter pedis]MBO1318994.1 hypothetical protein [Acanthopleuribacter pedis]